MAGGKPTRTTGARGRRGVEAARQYSSLPPSARTLGDIRSRVVVLVIPFRSTCRLASETSVGARR